MGRYSASRRAGIVGPGLAPQDHDVDLEKEETESMCHGILKIN